MRRSIFAGKPILIGRRAPGNPALPAYAALPTLPAVPAVPAVRDHRWVDDRLWLRLLPRSRTERPHVAAAAAAAAPALCTWGRRSARGHDTEPRSEYFPAAFEHRRHRLASRARAIRRRHCATPPPARLPTTG